MARQPASTGGDGGETTAGQRGAAKRAAANGSGGVGQPRRRASFGKRLVLGAVATLVALAVTEVLLRVLDLPRARSEFVAMDFSSGAYEFDAQRLWRLARDPSGGSANDEGLRGWLPSGPKTDAEWRIACVGDSCTFGTGVEHSQTYGVQLASLLERAHGERRVHSALLALPGYSTFQDRVLLEQLAARVDPDVVVLYCGAWNDYSPALRLTDAQWAEEFTSQSRWRLPRVAAALLREDVHETARVQRDAFERGEQPAVRRVPLVAFRANVRDMLTRARAIGADALVVLPPLPAYTRTRYPIAESYRAALRELASEHGVEVLDAQEVFDSFRSRLPDGFRQHLRADRFLFVDWAHPSVAGHALLARAMLARLAQRAGVEVEPAPDVAPIVSDVSREMRARLDWRPVPRATGYVIHFTSVDRPEVSGTLDVEGPEAANIDVWPGARFYVCVQAYNAAGAGPPSRELLLEPHR